MPTRSFKSLPPSIQEWAIKNKTEDQVTHPEAGLEHPLLSPDDMVVNAIMAARQAALTKLGGGSMPVVEVSVEKEVVPDQSLVQKYIEESLRKKSKFQAPEIDSGAAGTIRD